MRLRFLGFTWLLLSPAILSAQAMTDIAGKWRLEGAPLAGMWVGPPAGAVQAETNAIGLDGRMPIRLALDPDQPVGGSMTVSGTFGTTRVHGRISLPRRFDLVSIDAPPRQPPRFRITGTITDNRADPRGGLELRGSITTSEGLGHPFVARRE